MIILTLLCANFIGVVLSSVPFFFDIKEHKQHDLFSSVNKSVHLCTNFYNFACDSWIKNAIIPNNHPIWNKWEIINYKIIKRLEDMLTADKVASSHLHKAQLFYKACVNINNEESVYINELKILIKGLGGWPIADSHWVENEFAWEVSVAKIIRMLGVYPLLKLHVFVDLQNTSQHALYIEPGELNVPQTILSSPEAYKKIADEYEQWIIKTVNYLYPNKKRKLKNEAKEIIQFEVALTKLFIYKNKFEKISVNQLSQQFSLKWTEVFKKLFHGVSQPIRGDDKVVLRNRQYLQELILLILRTKRTTVANYVMWTVVKALSRDTTEYMRKLNFKLDNVVFNVKEDISQNVECVNKVLTFMDIILIEKYITTYIPQKTINIVTLMLRNIKEQFLKILINNKWLDDKTKSLSIDKISAMKYVIGAPNFTNTKSGAEIKYKDINIDNNHFVNVIQLRALKSKLDLKLLSDDVDFKWTDSLFEVNAYYNILQNVIFIPVGMLEPPFFNVSAPFAYNYGALGSLIGHEVSHALDDLGRHADKNGNVVNWWSEEAVNSFKQKLECFQNQHNEFNLNEEVMLGETIADNVGLQLSFNALSDLESANQQKYRRLKKYIDQIFFISYAQIWCETSNGNEIESGEHPPVRMRVLGTLKNSKEFHSVFHCPKLKTKQCSLW
ncbi:hypothetical protein FQA39_LY03261 [Lamprigera yunnana]|nr:hypothetical protein FQA39_LY03261 [Lamprigera yunnana]